MPQIVLPATNTHLARILIDADMGTSVDSDIADSWDMK